ncbi:hypothetical protein D3C87_1602160 [compost metagenome]
MAIPSADMLLSVYVCSIGPKALLFEVAFHCSPTFNSLLGYSKEASFNIFGSKRSLPSGASSTSFTFPSKLMTATTGLSSMVLTFSWICFENSLASGFFES